MGYTGLMPPAKARARTKARTGATVAHTTDRVSRALEGALQVLEGLAKNGTIKAGYRIEPAPEEGESLFIVYVSSHLDPLEASDRVLEALESLEKEHGVIFIPYIE